MQTHQNHCNFIRMTGGSEKIRTCWPQFNSMGELLAPNRNHDHNQQLWQQSAMHRQRIYSPQWLILCVMYVMYNAAFAATDLASKILTFLKAKWQTYLIK